MERYPNKRQLEVLKALHNFIAADGYAPTLRELADNLGIKACSTVHEHLQKLEVLGFVQRTVHARRGWRVVEDLYQKVVPRKEKEIGSFELPVLGFIAAGKPIEPHTDPNLYLAVAQTMINKDRKAFALQVKGDSMVEEGIFEGDYVVIQYQQEVQDGDIVVAILENGLATLKRIFFEPTRIRLEPANSSMAPIFANDVKIQGKVIAVIRKY